jgi:hypothetical protein
VTANKEKAEKKIANETLQGLVSSTGPFLAMLQSQEGGP